MHANSTMSNFDYFTYYAGAKFWRGAISARDSVSCLVHDISYTAGFAGETLE